MYTPSISTISLFALLYSAVGAEQKLRGVSNEEEETGVEQQELHSSTEGIAPRELSIPTGPGHEHMSVYNGHWGSWKSWATGSDGMFACGAELRFEDGQGIGDDTAANGLRLTFCDLNDWSDQYEDLVWGGSWGGWKGMKMCSEGKYIAGARVRYENPGGDDTALNGLEVYCTTPNWTNGEKVMVYPGIWGGWKPWAYRYSKLVKGAKVRFEDPIGAGDDTALNGIMFDVVHPFLADLDLDGL